MHTAILIVSGVGAGFAGRGLLVRHCTRKTIEATQWTVLIAVSVAFVLAVVA